MSTGDSRSTVEWRGDDVREKLLGVTKRAMDALMADCVDMAKHLCPVSTATLQRSIQMRPTVAEGRKLVGYWGSFTVRYALYVELGTGPHDILPKSKRALYWKGAEHPVPMVHHPGTHARPFLRPTADTIYPGLPSYIKRELGE